MDQCETTGKNVEEAIGAALRSLGAPREAVEVEVLSRGSSGFLGIGSSPACVRVRLRSEEVARRQRERAIQEEAAERQRLDELVRRQRGKAVQEEAAERQREHEQRMRELAEEGKRASDRLARASVLLNRVQTVSYLIDTLKLKGQRKADNDSYLLTLENLVKAAYELAKDDRTEKESRDWAYSIIKRCLDENKALLLSAINEGQERTASTALRISGEFASSQDDPDIMNALFRALYAEGDLALTARWALERSPFLSGYIIGKDEGPGSVCTACLHRFSEHTGRLSMSYWACRRCHGVRGYYQGVSRVIAVLDGKVVHATLFGEESKLQVDALERGSLFDFDEVRINDVGNDLVEEFVMAVRNDADSWRRSRYASVPIFLSQDHRLTRSKLNLLRDTFGNLEIQEHGEA